MLNEFGPVQLLMAFHYQLRLVSVLSCLFILGGCGGGGSDAPETGCLGEISTFSKGASSAESVSVSGVIEIESQTRIDSDTADDLRISQFTSNNCDDEAQSLPVTGIAGGYLSSTEGSYPVRSDGSARFDFYADKQDYFNAELSSGDRVSLQVFNDAGVDAPRPRLQIFDGSNREVFDSGSSASSQPILHVIESEAGNHILRVSSESGGPFRYVLIVADRNAESMMNSAYQDPDFIPGEAVITVRGMDSKSSSAKAMASFLSAESARELRPGVWHLRRGKSRKMATTDRALAKAETLAWVRRVNSQPSVAAASPNYIYHSQTTDLGKNLLYERQWNSDLISLPIAWQAAPNAGANVGVAVLDTGLFSSTPNSLGNWHPDLQENVQVVSTNSSTPDFVGMENDLDNQPGRDSNPADPGDGQPRSSNFHGTHVAGIIAAADNTLGVVGVAHQSTLVPVRVLGEAGTGTLADLIAAIEWAGSQDEIDVINLSLGGVGPDRQLQDAIDAAHNAGKLLVAAAGNQGTDEPVYPAAFANVVGVGAVDGAGNRASYSNIGPSVNLVAPGGDASRDANLDTRADLIISTWGTDDNGVFEPGYAGLQGTSMAAPHVSGVYALMKAERPQLDSGQFFALLLDGQLTEVVGNTTEYGSGLINAVKAMGAALEGNIPSILGASPSVLTFDSNSSERQILLNRYPSQAEMTVTGINTGEQWLEVGAGLVVGEPVPETISVRVNAELIGENESATTNLEVRYEVESGEEKALSVPVNVRLVDQTDARDAGRHYVLLVSTDSDRATEYQAVASAIGGQYNFAFENVEPGTYFLVAGTDMDNNGFICENGEACAEYPVNGLPQAIEVGGSGLDSLRLSTSFRRPTISALGGPRVNFDGYRLFSNAELEEHPMRRMEINR